MYLEPIIKLYARSNKFRSIKRKHGQDIIYLVKSFKHLKTTYVKTLADIKFIKSCKTENMIPALLK